MEVAENEEFKEENNPTFACVTRGDCSIFLCEKGQGNPGSWVCLNVSNREELDQIFQEYKGNAADIAEEPIDYPWGMREMLVRDIDKNVFRIGCSIEQ